MKFNIKECFILRSNPSYDLYIHLSRSDFFYLDIGSEGALVFSDSMPLTGMLLQKLEQGELIKEYLIPRPS